MLNKIIIRNFFSIADSQELSFEVSGKAPDLACFKVSRSDENTRFPTVIGFFGPNASGKSTILRAIVSSVLFACVSFDWVDQINHLFQPYRQKKWWGKPTQIILIEQSNQGLLAKFQHVGLDECILLPEESAGTQRFIEIFPRLHYVLETGSIAIIDELDTDLHPLLLPELFRWFSDTERNPYGAQLLFTAHNPALLDDLEKEQVFFTEKPSGQPSRVYGACEIKGLRREPSLMRKYLAGELGAVPHIG